MATVRTGNGWYNIDTGRYTVYNPQTGQIQTFMVRTPALQSRDINDYKDQIARGLQDGSIDINQYIVPTDSNYLGGRSNVNVSRQIAAVFDRIRTQYPQMSQDSAAQYANQWVMDRIAAGWDANEVENLMKDVSRGENSLNEDFANAVLSNIKFDEYNARDGSTTGEQLAPDPRQSIQDEMREFGRRMMDVVGPDSPQAQRIAELAAQAGNRYAASSGMGPGGLTSRGVASTAARAHTDLQTQREGLGLQALAAAGNQQLSVDQLQTQLQAQNQQANVLNASGIGGLVGSGLGLVGGAIGAAYTNGAMAPAIPGLMRAGGAGGQAVGGLISNTSQPPVQYGGQQQRTSSYGGRDWGTS